MLLERTVKQICRNYLVWHIWN